jgi:hypothetical protein
MKKSVYLLAALIVILTSCNKNELDSGGKEALLTDEEFKVLYQMRNLNDRIGINEATEYANNVIDFLEGDLALKSGSERKISSVNYVTTLKTKAAVDGSTESDEVQLPDTVAYVFNFGDDDGFAVVAADTRIETPILAYSGDGALDQNLDNPGVAILLDGTEDYIRKSIVEAQNKRDSLVESILTKLDLEETETKGIATNFLELLGRIRITKTTGKWFTESKLSPLSQVEWEQGAPFNAEVPYICSTGGSGGRAWAGCVAIATAQIMSYWKYPASIDGTSFRWEDMNSYTSSYSYYNRNSMYKTWIGDMNSASTTVKYQVAKLIERIGSHVGMKYGSDGSSAQTGDAVSYLRQVGFQGGSESAYNYNTVISSLNNRQPVLARGNSTKTEHRILWGAIKWATYSDGHAWIIDGYMTKKQPLLTTVEVLNAAGRVISSQTSTEYTTARYLHNNWGWSGFQNGYFLNDSFNSNIVDEASNTKSGEAGNFQFEVKIYPFIKK